MTAKPDLADRVEASVGADRELDWVIYCIQHPDRLPHYEEGLSIVRAGAEENGIWEKRADAVIQGQRDLCCPRYTRSLDAAMTLLPKGMILRQYMSSKYVPHSCEVSASYGHGGWVGNSDHSFALALTAACIRAHALSQKGLNNEQ